MSMEDYAVHVAPRGGKIDLIVDEITAAREAALQTRWDYAKTKGAVGLYQSEKSVSGLIFKDAASVPAGWKVQTSTADGVIAEPKAADKTKPSRAAAAALRAELAALPAMPGAWEFTNKIGSAPVILARHKGFAMAHCYFHRIGETTFVMTPWHHPKDAAGENVDMEAPTPKTAIAFQPEGCERVPLSAYYLAKEKAPAAA